MSKTSCFAILGEWLVWGVFKAATVWSVDPCALMRDIAVQTSRLKLMGILDKRHQMHDRSGRGSVSMSYWSSTGSFIMTVDSLDSTP